MKFYEVIYADCIDDVLDGFGNYSPCFDTIEEANEFAKKIDKPYVIRKHETALISR